MNSDQVALALNADDVERIHAQGKMAAVLDIEGSYDLDGDLGVLRDLYRLGLRSAQLSAHNWNQNYADSCCSPAKWNGLTPHGRDVIREMNRLGMVINVSHSSDDTISQAIDVSDGPVVATHHGLRSVNNIPRNMPDWLLKKLAAKGGVIGFQIGSEFNYPKEYRLHHRAPEEDILGHHQYSGSGEGQDDLRGGPVGGAAVPDAGRPGAGLGHDDGRRLGGGGGSEPSRWWERITWRSAPTSTADPRWRVACATSAISP